MKWLLGWLIRQYQRFISPLMGPRCRYYPSCSEYGRQAIDVHGAVKGTLLTIWRILRCNPWTKGGVDEVPAPGQWPSAPLGHAELMEKWREEETDQPVAEQNNDSDTVLPTAPRDTQDYDQHGTTPDVRKD